MRSRNDTLLIASGALLLCIIAGVIFGNWMWPGYVSTDVVAEVLTGVLIGGSFGVGSGLLTKWNSRRRRDKALLEKINRELSALRNIHEPKLDLDCSEADDMTLDCARDDCPGLVGVPRKPLTFEVMVDEAYCLQCGQKYRCVNVPSWWK